MTVRDSGTAAVTAYVAGPHPVHIGATWTQAASGETLPVEDPATGRVIASIPAGDAEDVDRAEHARNLRVGNGLDAGTQIGPLISDRQRAGPRLHRERTRRGVRLLDAGNVRVTCYGRDRSLPFGGFTQSGWGRENGPEGLDAFLEKKSVHIHL